MKTARRVTTKSLGMIMLTLEEMRKLNTSMTINVALVFLLVASEPGITAKEIERSRACGCSSARDTPEGKRGAEPRALQDGCDG